MDFGKLLSILGGLLTTIAIYLLTLFAVLPNYSYAIGGFIAFNSVIVNSAIYAGMLGVDVWVIYLILGGYVIFTTTGFMQLGGARSRISAFIGSIIPLALGVLLILYSFLGLLPVVPGALNMFLGASLWTHSMTTYIPFHYFLGGIYLELGLGTWIMVGGSLLTFVSVFIKRDHEKF